MKVAFLGNFSVPYSSESHEAASIESLGHTVTRIQEGEVRASDIPVLVKEHDVFWWVQTLGLAITGGTVEERRTMLNSIKDMGIPTVAYHLDLWWGLNREMQILTEPYFECDHIFSTDGGHNEQWEAAGINHHYLPPAVYHVEAYDGLPDTQFVSDVAFVGSWRSYGHPEHEPTRLKMLRTLHRKYGRRFKCWPQKQAIRGTDLTDLYASVKVVVGDSCLAGHIPGYWSDRVPETTGRGGFLIHPYVPGILNAHPDLVTYKAGDWDSMIDRIDHYLASDAARESNRRENAAWTREHHTYQRRAEQIFETVGL